MEEVAVGSQLIVLKFEYGNMSMMLVSLTWLSVLFNQIGVFDIQNLT